VWDEGRATPRALLEGGEVLHGEANAAAAAPAAVPALAALSGSGLGGWLLLLLLLLLLLPENCPGAEVGLPNGPSVVRHPHHLIGVVQEVTEAVQDLHVGHRVPELRLPVGKAAGVLVGATAGLCPVAARPGLVLPGVDRCTIPLRLRPLTGEPGERHPPEGQGVGLAGGRWGSGGSGQRAVEVRGAGAGERGRSGRGEHQGPGELEG